MSAIAVGVSAEKAMELWVRSGHDGYLLAQYQQAANAAGVRLDYAQWGDQLLIETTVTVKASE